MGSFGVGHPETVMGNGPATLNNASNWTLDDANDLARFLQIVEALNKSRWFRGGVELSYDTDGTTSGFSNPDSDSVVAAIALIRQFMLKQDKIFEHTLKAYRNYCGDGVKILFVDMELQFFQKLLIRPLHISEHHDEPELKKLTVERMIDLVVYGSGLFHRKSRDKLEPEFSALLSNCPREKILFAFHACCRSVLRHAFNVLPVIRQDFTHWINSGECTPPSRAGIANLFDDIPKRELPPMKIGEERITWNLGSR